MYAICLDSSANLWYYFSWVIPRIEKSGSHSAALFFFKTSSLQVPFELRQTLCDLCERCVKQALNRFSARDAEAPGCGVRQLCCRFSRQLARQPALSLPSALR
jgi:hypothetical protein